MSCPQCRQDNPPGAKFCSGCGGRLEVVCPACGHANLPGSRFCNECGKPVATPSVAAPATRISPELHASLPGREDPDLPPRARGGAQAGHGAVRRHEGLARAARRPRPGGGPEAPRPRPRAHDGGGAPLRGHRQPGHGRRHHGALRRAPGPRGPRRARLLCRPRHAAGDPPLHGRGPAGSRHRGPGPRRPQLRRGGRAGDRERSPHGLLGGGPDHPPRRAHGAARDAGLDAADRRDAPAGRGVRRRSSRSVPSRSRDMASPVEVFELAGPSATRTRLQAAAARGLTRFVGRDAGARPPPPGPRQGARSSGAGRRRGGRARRGQIAPALGVHPLAPDPGLARARVELRLLRQGERVSARHRPLQELLPDRGARRCAQHPGEGHRASS